MTQLVQAARSAVDGLVEVRLSPEELGRVRLAMTPGDAGMTVQVTAERQETLDLIRRHIDMLANDLKDQGFSNLSFSFAKGHDDTDHAPGEEDGTHAIVTSSDFIDDEHVSKRALTDGRLDLRL